MHADLIASEVTDARGHAVTECAVAGQAGVLTLTPTKRDYAGVICALVPASAVRRPIQALRAAGRGDIEP